MNLSADLPAILRRLVQVGAGRLIPDRKGCATWLIYRECAGVTVLLFTARG